MTPLLGAAWRSARGALWFSVSVALVAAAVVTITMATSGRTVAAERSVLAAIDQEELTTLELVDDRGLSRLDSQIVTDIAALSTVAWVVGLGPVEDLRPAGLPGAGPLSGRPLVGSSPALRHRPDAGQLAGLGPAGSTDAGVALLGAQSLQASGLVDGVGLLAAPSGATFPVVGPFTTDPPLDTLDNEVLIVDPDFAGPIRRIIIQVEEPADVGPTGELLRTMVGEGVRLEVAEELARVRATVQGELGGAARATVLQTMAAGLCLLTLILSAALHARRKDFGRRRALGASRGQLVAIVVLSVTMAAVPGILLGLGGGSLLVWRLTGATAGWEYPLAVCVLTLLVTVLAAIGPAVSAAWRDPVRALRVP